MNQAKRALSSLRLAKSTFSTQFTRNLSAHHHHQVTLFHLSSPPPTARPSPPYISPIPNFQSKFYFSSKPEETLELVLSEDWSQQLEGELSELTHETVFYVLKRLQKDPKRVCDFFNWVVGKTQISPSCAMYSFMLRVYANKEWIKEFWVTAYKMKENGFLIDSLTYHSILAIFKGLKMSAEVRAFTEYYNRSVKENANGDVVKQVVSIVGESDWSDEVEKKLEEMKIKVSDDFVLTVMKDLIKCPLKALKVFRWVGENSRYEHNSITYNGIVRVLGQEDSIGEFWDLVKEMKSMGYEMDLDTYTKIQRRFQRSRLFKDAVELYEYMMDGPYKPSHQDTNMLLRSIGWSRCLDLDLVFRVVDKYEAAGNSLSKATYDIIHRSLTSVGKFVEAEKILTTMRDAGYEPDNVTYSQLIFGLCKANRLDEASEVLDVMEAHECIPDLKTWTVLIQGHFLAKETDKAVLLFTKMIEKGCEADADLLDVLIKGHLSEKKTIAAYELLKEMVVKVRLKPWQATYKELIQNLLGERNFEEALNLLRLMKKHNYPPLPEPFLQHVSKFGTVDDALEFLKALSHKEYPPVSAYQKMFQHFFQEGRQFEAKDLLFKCPPHIRKHSAICAMFGSVESTNMSAS